MYIPDSVPDIKNTPNKCFKPTPRGDECFALVRENDVIIVLVIGWLDCHKLKSEDENVAENAKRERIISSDDEYKIFLEDMIRKSWRTK